MAFNKMTTNVENVSALPDSIAGQSSLLKNTFDKAGKDIKEFINTHIDDLGLETSASNLGALDKKTGNKTTIQSELDKLNDRINPDYTDLEIQTDNELNLESENAVSNKTITGEFNKIKGDLYTQDRYNIASYEGNVIYLDLPLTSYENGKIINIIAPVSLSAGELNINNLGNKTINGEIVENGKYTLVYNGESWDIASKDYVVGSYTGDDQASQFIELGFTPSAVFVVDAYGQTKDNNDRYTGALATKFYNPSSGGYKIVSIETNGFNVYYKSSADVYTNSGEAHYYIAFR